MSDWSFFGADTSHIAVHLLQLRVLMVHLLPCFFQLLLEAFPISAAVKKCLICKKVNFYSIISFNIFLWKYHHALSSCSQHTWNPKQNKVDVFAKPTFQEPFQEHFISATFNLPGKLEVKIVSLNSFVKISEQLSVLAYKTFWTFKTFKLQTFRLSTILCF